MFYRRLATFVFALGASWHGIVTAEHTPEQIVATIIGVQAEVPEEARTAASLGTQRGGSGVVIGADGLIVTIGYLILEASSVTVSDRNGVEIPAEIVAYDYATGFGLLRAQRSLDVLPLEFSTEPLSLNDPALVISSGGSQPIIPVRVVKRADYPGYWEYLLNDAIFTTPPHPQFAGAALIDSNGHLAGIGSLAVNLSEEGGKSIIANMFVPIDQFSPILEDMVEHGRSLTPRRPWLGLYTNMMRGHLYVDRVAEGGPAQTAGIEEDDIILSVSGEPVSDMADFYRKVWSLGEPGITVSVEILRGGQVSNVDIESADRYDWLRLNPEPSGKNLL